MLSTSILSYCNKLLDDDCQLLSLPPRKTISSSLSSTSQGSTANNFRVKYLGSTLVTTKSNVVKNGITAFQRPLLDIYSLAQKKSLQRNFYSGYSLILNQVVDVCNYGIVIGESDPTAKTTLKADGSANLNKVNDVVVTKVITPLTNVVLWAGVRFHSRVVKHKRKSQLGAAFLPLACSDAVLNKDCFATLTRKQRFLVSLSHPPLFMCAYRKVADPKIIECHLFICGTPEDAVNLGSLLSNTQQQSSKIGALELPPPGQMGVYSYKGFQKFFPPSSPDVHLEISDSDALQSNKYSGRSLSHYSRTSSDCKHHIRRRNEKNLRKRLGCRAGLGCYEGRGVSACDLPTPTFSELSLSDSNVKCDDEKRRHYMHQGLRSINYRKKCAYCCDQSQESKTTRKRELDVYRKSTFSGLNCLNEINAHHHQKGVGREPAQVGLRKCLPAPEEKLGGGSSSSVIPSGLTGKGDPKAGFSNHERESKRNKARVAKAYSSFSERDNRRCADCGNRYKVGNKQGKRITSSEYCRYFGDSNESSDGNSTKISSSYCNFSQKASQEKSTRADVACLDHSRTSQQSRETNNYNGYVVTVDHKHKEQSTNNRNKPKKTMVITKTIQLSTETESNSDSVLPRSERDNHVCSQHRHYLAHLVRDDEGYPSDHPWSLERIQESREMEPELSGNPPKTGGVKMYLPQGVKTFNNYDPVQKWATLSLDSDLDEEVVKNFNYSTQMPALMPVETRQICKLSPLHGSERRSRTKSKSTFFRKMRNILAPSQEKSFLHRLRKKRRRRKAHLFDSGVEVTSCENSLNNMRIEDILARGDPHVKCNENVWSRTYERSISEYEHEAKPKIDCQRSCSSKSNKVNSSDSGMDENDCLNSSNSANCKNSQKAREETRLKVLPHPDIHDTTVLDYRNWSNVNLQKELGYLP